MTVDVDKLEQAGRAYFAWGEKTWECTTGNLRKYAEDECEFLDVVENGWQVMIDEIRRLRRGDFTREEIHDICHNLHGTVSVDEFSAGCAREQYKLYGCAPDFRDAERWRKWCQIVLKHGWAKMTARHEIEGPLKDLFPDVVDKEGLDRSMDYVGSFRCPKCGGPYFGTVNPVTTDGNIVECHCNTEGHGMSRTEEDIIARKNIGKPCGWRGPRSECGLDL